MQIKNSNIRYFNFFIQTNYLKNKRNLITKQFKYNTFQFLNIIKILHLNTKLRSNEKKTFRSVETRKFYYFIYVT